MDLSQLEIRECDTDEEFLTSADLLNEFFEPQDQKDPNQMFANYKKARELGYQQYHAYMDSELVGVIGLRPFFDPLEDHFGYEVNNLIIPENLRGQGIGKTLMNYVVSKAKEQNANFIRLFVSKTDDRLQKFYTELGYQSDYDLMLQEF